MISLLWSVHFIVHAAPNIEVIEFLFWFQHRVNATAKILAKIGECSFQLLPHSISNKFLQLCVIVVYRIFNKHYIYRNRNPQLLCCRF